MKSTLLTNIFNEEYLLPFWLQHHKDMFDDIVIVDYNSTDKSVEICRQICPCARIITTRNKWFAAEGIDKEFMDLESSIEGIKVVLNTTEFLFTTRPVNATFAGVTKPVSYSMTVYSPYSKNRYDIHNHYTLCHGLLHQDVVYHCDRWTRQIHTFPHGNYTIGRHNTRNPITPTNEMYVIWMGYYPLNDSLLSRKLQIQSKIPQVDKDRGFGSQHLFTLEKMLSINSEKVESGVPLATLNPKLHALLSSRFAAKTFVVTGGCGFIGSHMVDRLISLGHKVVIIDNVTSGHIENANTNAILERVDICEYESLKSAIARHGPIDGLFHFAAIARTPWCIDDPLLCYRTNVTGTLNVLEVSRQLSIKRVVLSSSNVVYAYFTPYRTSKEALEGLAKAYTEMYGLSVISLRYSNVYGKRQSEIGPSPNVFAALRKSKKETGKLVLTGDGTQTRNYTHVSDIVSGNLLSMFSSHCGVIDLCTGVPVALNDAARYFDCPIEYIPDRPGDVKHILQSPTEAFSILGWKALITLDEGIQDVL